MILSSTQNVVSVLLLTLLLMGCQNSDTDAQAPSSDANNESGKIVLTEYSDYQCPTCAQYHPVVERLKEHFGDSLELNLRFFPLNSHQFSALAARAAQAAKNQGKFHEMHNLLFRNQSKWANSSNPVTTFVGYARELNLDMQQFQNDLNSSQTQKAVMQQKQKGEQEGVRGTPTFFIDGAIVEDNPRSYAEFEKLIRQKLNKKQPG